MEGAGPVVAAPLSQARVVSRILSHSSAVVDETLCQIKFASKLYVWVKEMLTAGTEQSALVRRLLGLCQAGVEGVDGLVDRAVERAVSVWPPNARCGRRGRNTGSNLPLGVGRGLRQGSCFPPPPPKRLRIAAPLLVDWLLH